ncbi:bromodomain and WD repeat-containing protein 3 isoform X2 [Scaptodrosophila lebanonensis]|uniref:Bromodomain and WD repeat-containing protein 3 isoform X2 n=1 Tax=Drosophila lebanonensis TaxID=7225 RepID=A0A6J2TJP5_DROLE|nr:bromodomain and WD repeat-containing protein 3 isoform X2 [Scaptodrosophila lebanonensis]
MDNRQHHSNNVLVPELYFLISKYLAAGPLKETAKVLVQELEQKQVLPRRIDWQGNEHEQTFAELEDKYRHISSNHLLELCSRLGPLMDRELAPSVLGISSLLGSGRQSLLRTKDTVYKHRTQLDYITRLNAVSLPDSAITLTPHNLTKVLTGREYGGSVRRKLLVPTGLYGKIKLLRRTVGHLSSVYCVLFDRTGRYIITGADDLLIKIWSATDGRLLATLRGASAEITDIAINLDNTMLAAGSVDRILRVWDMQTTSPIAVLAAHTGMVTSVNFCPSPRSDLKYLVTTSTDGSIAFWQYSTPRGQKITFAPKPTQYHEKLRPGQAQMMCTTFSPGGMFLAAGSADHHVRVYMMGEDGPKRILETEAYTDAVDSVQWSHRGLRFISGSKDGTAHIWTFESQQWKSVKLCMTERLRSCPEPEEGKKLKVTMVAWDASDRYVITAVNDFTIKIWESKTAKLHRVLRGHKDELYVLESNPKDEHVLLSAGHDGQVFLWDIEQGISVARFFNDIDGQGHGSVFDAKWSPDGTMIAATDSHGHILIFGLGIGVEKYKILPNELFFHTDFRPLLRDAQHHVVDEQTQIMPHLMPPPFLVDADGNPHPAKYQRFVPGRETCSTDQLIPNLTVGIDGIVIEDNVNATVNAGAPPAPSAANANFLHIDRMIAALANRQGNANTNDSAASNANQSYERLVLRQGQDQLPDSNGRNPSRGSLPGAGNVLGGASGSNAFGRRHMSEAASTPRQGVQWGRPPSEQQQPPTPQPPAQPLPIKFVRRTYVRPLKYGQLQALKHTIYSAGQFEIQEYKREMRRRPIMINTASAASAQQAGVGRPRNTRSNGAGRPGRRRGAQSGQQPAYRTRAVRDQEAHYDDDAAPAHEEEEEEDTSNSSGDTSYSNVEENLEDSSDESETDSSDYSDWVADTPGPNLEPPKRSKRKPLSRRRTVSDDSSDDEAAGEGQTQAQSRKRGRKRVLIPPAAPNGEIPELYRPAEWLSEVIPRKAPYYPQMGDEVVYFRQGHQRYLEAVRLKKVYKLSHSSEPWNFRTLRDHELVRVIGIKYEIRPPRLCCLKLAMIDDDGNMTGTTFKIKYHDMPDVLDFLVLRQTFDLAVQRNWSIGDRFRCMIGDGWWMGQIESRRALSADFPESFFMCFRVRWDNGEYEYMSPWDMEPVDEERLPDEVGGAVPVLPEEIRATLYQPKSEEWHRGDRDGTCRRIINGLEQVMRLSIAEHFLAPVDLNIYPDYAYLIEYPIDLTTVKSRFENHFYRRITTAQFDVRYLATNAEQYNRRHTSIVKHARIVTDLCLRIIREPDEIDVAAVYHQLVDVYHSSESENEVDSDVVPSTSTGPTTSAAAAAARQRVSSTRRSNRIRSDGDWRSDCRQLLDLMWTRPDSLPFREPVDTIEFPDYLEIIATPMDLRTVKEDLLGGNYDDPLDFAKDVRLIFQNSKNYNTNKRSRIYSMTLRLSALFESHIKTVVSNWKAARRRANKNKSGSSGRGSSSPAKRTPTERTRAAGPSTRRNQKTTARTHSEDDDDDDDDEEVAAEAAIATTRGTQRTRRRNGATITASISGSNRVTSSSSAAAAHQRRNGANVNNASTHESSSNSESEEEETSAQATSDASSDEDDEEEAHADSPEQRTRRPGRGRGGGGHRRRVSDDEETANDSEESYNPNDRRRRRRGGVSNAGGRKRKADSARRSNKRRRQEEQTSNNRATGAPTRRTRRLLGSSDEDSHALAHKSASYSQPDESTQDTLTSTPRKKGRSARLSNGPSTSAAAAAAVTETLNYASPSRNTRANGGAGLNGGRRPQLATENDHSYHLPVRNGRIIESDTDSHGQMARPTRQSVKRALMDWARGSDIEEEEEEESEEAEEILPTPTKDDMPSTSRAALGLVTSGVPSSRQLRTNRNTVVSHAESDDDDDDSDNAPLASNQQKTASSLARTNAPAAPHPLVLRRRAQTPTHMTRSHATSTTTSSSAVAGPPSSQPGMTTHDHNYLGSVSAAAARAPRRVLSRHQRNADELDSSLDPLENSRLLAVITNHRRPTSTTTTATTTSTTNPSPSARTRRLRVRNSQSQTEATEEEEDEEHDDDAASDEGTDGGSSTQASDDDEEEATATDSEDNQPLTSYVAPRNGRVTRKRKETPPRDRRTRRQNPRQPQRSSRERRRRALSENSFINDDEDDEDYKMPRQRRGNPRSGRNQKRPRYNEQSDEEEQHAQSSRKRMRNGGGDSYAGTSHEPTDDNPDDEDQENAEGSSAIDSDEQLVSVSSRGRVRKISAKMRGLFKE